MNNSITGLLAAIAAIILCGVPGFLIGVFAAGRLILGSAPGMYPSTISLTLIGASVILVLIPVGVGFFTLRTKGNGQ